VADRVAVMLSRRGYSRLAGGIDLHERIRHMSDDLTSASDEELLAMIEVFALDGYGLSADDFVTIKKDFSDKGLPPRHLELVLTYYKTWRSKAA
jgi:hypothetical protein